MTYANSLKNYALQHIKSVYPDIVHKGELEKKASEWGYEHENIGRRCRELQRAGLIEVVYVKSMRGVRCAAYKWIPPIPKSAEEKAKESEELLIKSLL